MQLGPSLYKGVSCWAASLLLVVALRGSTWYMGQKWWGSQGYQSVNSHPCLLSPICAASVIQDRACVAIEIRAWHISSLGKCQPGTEFLISATRTSHYLRQTFWVLISVGVVCGTKVWDAVPMIGRLQVQIKGLAERPQWGALMLALYSKLCPTLTFWVICAFGWTYLLSKQIPNHRITATPVL